MTAFMSMFYVSDEQIRVRKTVIKTIIKIPFTQGIGVFYAGKQPQILMKFALTLRRARS